jgi:hypothetical protein
MANIRFNASQVAALLGQHPWRPREKALLEALRTNRPDLWKTVRVENPQAVFDYRNVQVPELAPIINSAAPVTTDTVQIVATSVATAAIVAAAANNHTEHPTPAAAAAAAIVSAATNNEHPTPTAAAAAATAAAAAGFETIAQEGRLEQVVAEMVTVQRGVVQEEAILDRVAMNHGPIVRQQEHVRLDGPGFVVFGRIDGMTSNGVVVEAKSRRDRLPKDPPAYDKIQLQVYLRASNRKRGLLAELVQDGSAYRETEVRARWSPYIIPGLQKAADEIRTATLETARGWAR